MDNNTDQEIASALYSSDRYSPSVRDVIDIKEALHKKSTLPYELVDAIIDMAEYWPHTTTITSQSAIIRAGRNQEENRFLLRSYPLGYIPPTNSNLRQEYDMNLQREQSYQTLKPKPWPESIYVPDEATDEVLSKWSLRSLPKGEYPCRKIVFTISSHDQGWGGEIGQRGTYVGSYTWFDVGLEKMTACREALIVNQSEMAPVPQIELNSNSLPTNDIASQAEMPAPLICNLRTIVPSTTMKGNEIDPDNFHHDLIPSTMTLQKNITASRETMEHRIVWSSNDKVVPESLEAAQIEKLGRGRDTANGEFVRNLKVGDVVTVWGKARFPGWMNHIEEVKMDVYWAV